MTRFARRFRFRFLAANTVSTFARRSIRTLLYIARTGGVLFQIPLFQRREAQWTQLRQFCVELTSQGEGATHSLKRLLTLSGSGIGKRSSALVIDDQQRLSTVCVLLEALRD